MAPGKTDQLVKQLRQWYETHAMPQKALALTLGFTPQGLSEIFAGRNRPTGEQTLRMLEFLNENMKSETIALPNLRTVRDDDEHLDLLNGKPKTLGAAKEMIDGCERNYAARRLRRLKPRRLPRRP